MTDADKIKWLTEENARLTTALKQAIQKRDIAMRDLKRYQERK